MILQYSVLNDFWGNLEIRLSYQLVFILIESSSPVNQNKQIKIIKRYKETR